jgi:hypothetical protein
MLELARKALQARYIKVLMELNEISKELAEYHAERADEQQMRIQIQCFDKIESEKRNSRGAQNCPASPPSAERKS